jgi:hypothetical protein
MSGKGSKRRPTDEAAYAEGWERLWGSPDAVRTVPETAGSDQAGSQEAGRGNEAGGR